MAKGQVLISLLLGDKLNSDGLEFGLEGGFNWSQVTGLETNDYNRTFNLGFYFDIRIKDSWSLYTGTLVKASMGVGNLTVNDLVTVGSTPNPDPGSYDQEIRYFLVPLFLRYHFPNRIYVEAGPQLGLMHQAFVEFESSSDDPEIRIKDYNKEAINTFAFGLAAGIGYKLQPGPKGMSIGFSYHHGLSRVYESIDSYNRGLFLKLNIPIGAGKVESESTSSH